MKGSGGVCWKCGRFLYALWVLESATILKWVGKERNLRSNVVPSWWLQTSIIVMVAGRESLTLYASCMIPQSAWRYFWMEKGVS